MAPFSLLGYIKGQLTPLPPVTVVDLTGKTVIVTGSNQGLGLETARHFARMNPAKLVLAVRNTNGGEAAADNISASTGLDRQRIDVRHLDLGIFQSVKAFAENWESDGLGKVDILLGNAGVWKKNFEPTHDGWETTLQVNVLSTFLLSFLMLKHLRQAAEPRLIIVSSDVHFIARLGLNHIPRGPIFEELNDKKKASMRYRYDDSKLLEILLVRKMDEVLQAKGGTRVVVNTVNPGSCHSELIHEAGLAMAIVKKLLARTTEEGSRTLVHVAVSKEAGELSGKYFSDCREAEPSDFVISAKGKETGERLWVEQIEILTQVTGLDIASLL